MNNLLFLGNLGAGEIIVIALIVLLLFGGKKIPELMKGLGKGVRSFFVSVFCIHHSEEKESTSDIEKHLIRPMIFICFYVIKNSFCQIKRVKKP